MTIKRRTLIKGAVAMTGGMSLGSGPIVTPAFAASSDMLHKYQKIFASTVEEDVACWYLGTMFLRLPGRPDVPVLQAETIMIYRAVAGSSPLRIRWSEVGYFRDPVTGLPAEQWLNPVTGKLVPTPRTFMDGPGEYTVSETSEGLQVKLMQTGATIESVTVAMDTDADRVVWQQTEKKVRALPGKGKSGAPKKATTILTLWANRAEVEDKSRTNVDASGSYSFESEGLAAWTGLEDREGSTIVRGIMRKAKANDAINKAAWEVLEKAYPNFFASGRAAPRWSELFKG